MRIQYLLLTLIAFIGSLTCSAPHVRANYVIATGDEWPLSDQAFSQNSASSTTLATNLANFIGGTNYLILENAAVVNPYGSSFQNILEGLGRSVTINPSPFSASLIHPFDAIFLAGMPGSGTANATILNDYVLNGGTVCVALVTGNWGDAPTEAAAWNTFLNQWGINAGDTWFNPDLENVSMLPNSHSLRSGVDFVTWGYGQEITETDPTNPLTSIALTGAFGGATGNRGIMGVRAVPEPCSGLQAAIGLMALVVCRRLFPKRNQP